MSIEAAAAALSRRRWLGLAAAALAGGASAQPASAVQKLAPGTRLAPFHVLDAEGRRVAVPAPGRACVVNFWASWCEPCRTEMPLLQQLAEFYGERLLLQPVNHKERAAAVLRHVQSARWSVPVLLDPQGEGAAAWGVKVFPTTVGFDAQGQPRWRVTGAIDWSGPEAGRLVDSLWG